VYVRRESIPLSLLCEGLGKLRYDGVVKELHEALEAVKFPMIPLREGEDGGESSTLWWASENYPLVFENLAPICTSGVKFLQL
jgi:hypothetical protein